MPQNENIMKYETTLPRNFNGIFEFTNWSDEEFVGVWNKVEYRFPAKARSPMIIPEHSPLEIQHIRKKFAKDLAEREFFKSKKYEKIRSPEGELGNRTMSGIHTANTYSLDDLKDGIQRCLEPLQIKDAKIGIAPSRDLSKELKTDENGDLVSGAVGNDKDLEKLARGELRPSLDRR